MLDALLANLDYAYDLKAWHGPNLRGALRGLTPDEVLWRPAKNRHNIWELTAHAAYWKYAARRKLTGEGRGTFPLKGSNFIPSPATLDAKAWRSLIAILDAEHRRLRAAIAALTAVDTKQRRLILGVAAHDVYHAGQIRLIQRLRRA